MVGAMTTPEDVRIPSGREQLAAYLYRPESARGDAPCVVMAHGFSATLTTGCPPTPRRSATPGLPSLYSTTGISVRRPASRASCSTSAASTMTTVRSSRGLASSTESTRIESSCGARRSAAATSWPVAAADPHIAAVISQAPFTDAIPTLMHVPLKNAVRLTFAGLRDQLRGWRGRAPLLAPAVGELGTLAAMTEPDAKPGFDAIVPPESLWRNEFAARLMLRFPFYRPGLKAPQLKMPLLVCVCEKDTTTPPASTIKAAERAPRGELRRYPYGHFDIYTDPKVKADQVDFLRRVVAEVTA
jgi:pimeloyl-ACP methyl ester carboxylesterase